MFYYKQVENGKIISVEAKSRDIISPHFVKTTKMIYDNFIASLPIGEPEPERDYGAEIDEIKAKIADYDDLKAKVEALEKK